MAFMDSEDILPSIVNKMCTDISENFMAGAES